MELNHFSHEHPLVLSEESYIGHYYHCNACWEKIVGLSYCCEECPYALHKWCADLTRKLTHHPLHPNHALLLEFPKLDQVWEDFEEIKEVFVCEFCKEKIYYNFMYGCTQCSFNLHVHCVSLPKLIMLDTIYQNSNRVGKGAWLAFRHMYIYPEDYTCKICKEGGEGSRFITVIENSGYELEERDNSWHIQCAMLPKIVKHERHLHDLTIHPPIEKDLNYDECYCDACEEDRDPEAWVYYCESCEFAAHLSCGITKSDRPKQLILSTHPIYVEPKEELKILSTDEEEDEIDYIKREEERGTERISQDRKGLKELKHFCHEHPLILYDEEWNREVKCNACCEPIFGNTYICYDCKFYLHELCAELPQEIHHRLHSEHPLTLLSREGFQCNCCRIFFSKTLSFCCEECDFNLYIVCAVLPENLIHHESHEHPLTGILEGFGYRDACNACKMPSTGPMLSCEPCGFYFHLVCALYPPTGKAKTHRHNLALTYSFQEDPNALEFICDACENPRTPNHLLYSCSDGDCYFVAHVNCVVPELFHKITELGFDQFYRLRFPM